ncbi:putative quinol monooxygenase [Jatrophihabitans sp. DSM 45814]
MTGSTRRSWERPWRGPATPPGSKILELATIGMDKSNSSDRFTILSEDGDPDVLWNVEVFRSEQAKDAYENSPLADELRDEIIALGANRAPRSLPVSVLLLPRL